MRQTRHDTIGFQTPATYGLLEMDDVISLETDSGDRFRMNELELGDLCARLLALKPRPPVQLARSWNTCTGFMGIDAPRERLTDLAPLLAALLRLLAQPERETTLPGASLARSDLRALRRFVADALARGSGLVVWES